MTIRISQHVVDRFKERFRRQTRGKSDDYVRCMIRRSVLTGTEVDMTAEASARYDSKGRRYLRSGDIVFVMDGVHVVTAFPATSRFVG